MSDLLDLFGRWQLDNRQVLDRMSRAPTLRERARWRALRLLGRVLEAAQVAEALGRDAHRVAGAHFRADADLRGKGMLRGEPALLESTSPRWARRPATTRRSG